MKVFCILAILTLSICARGQEPAYFTITQQQGLPSNTVYDLFQDNKGFLWVATEKGVARFNGEKFIRYTNSSIRSTAVSNLFEDQQSNIWLHNFFGEILYIKNDSLKKLSEWDEKYAQGFPSITNLGDRLLVSNWNKLFYYELLSKKWLEQKISIAEFVNFNHHVKDENGIIWVCYSTETATYVESLNTSSKIQYKFKNTEYKLTRNVVRLALWQNELYIFDQLNHTLLKLKGGNISSSNLSNQSFLKSTRQIHNISDSILAFLGPNGLFLIDKEGKNTHLLPGKNVSCATVDKEGGLWIGTLNEGLYYFPVPNTEILNKRNTLYTKLAQDPHRKRLFAGSYNGEVDIYTSNGQLIHVIKSSENKEVQSIFLDTVRNEFYVFTNSLKRYDAISYKLLDDIDLAATKSICHIPNGVAIASSAGVYLYDPIKKKRKSIIGPLRTSSVAYQKERSTLWIGSQKGLYKYNLTDSTSVVWQPKSGRSSPGISCLLSYNKMLVAGTYTDGLYILYPDGAELHISSINGLPSDNITAIASAGKNIWIASDAGLSRLNLESNNINHIDHTKGLLAQEVYDVKEIDNNIWVIHALGLQMFKTIPGKNVNQPVLHITSIKSAGQKINQSKIVLPEGAQQLSINFDVSNNFRSRGQAKIYYRIKELDTQWNVTNLKNPVAYYPYLPYGNLTFEAKAFNEDNTASINTILLPIIVPAPFWRKAWFVTLIAILIVMLTWWLISKRLEKIKELNKQQVQKLTQEQELRIAQLTSIRAQMNPHFIFNTMSLIQGKVLHGLKEEANEQIQHFSNLLRKVLDLSAKEMILLQQEIEVLENYLSIEKGRFDGSLSYTITVNEEAKQEMIRIPSLLTQPFVENALRHGLMHKSGEKILLIDFSLNNDVLTITIKDNGIGRKASYEFNKVRRKDHQSFAVEANRKRINLLNAARRQRITMEIIDHYNDHHAATGTSVIIQVPLDNDVNG